MTPQPQPAPAPPPGSLGPGLEEVHRTWTRLGEVDPLWAILSDPRKENGKWDTRRFYRSGEIDIEKMLRHAGRLGLPVTLGTALDFGCGVGRVTQAMSRRFAHAHGVDIAESMIRRARQHDAGRDGAGGRYGATYHHNPRPDLALFADGTFDFVYSMIVLQHMPPADSCAYVREFLRVVRPGGVVAFQLPAELAALPLAPGQSYATEALPDEAFQARIVLRSRVGRVGAGSRRRLRVQVRNTSPVRWRAVGTPDGRLAVRLANQWRAEDGAVVRQDDGRAALPRDLHPGHEATVGLRVTAPFDPGRYVLALDLVQEGVSWFGSKGHIPTEVGLEVRPGRQRQRGSGGARSAPDGPAKPAFEMHGVPRAEVVRAVEQGGGKVVAVVHDPAAGERWVSYLYFCTKAPPAR